MPGTAGSAEGVGRCAEAQSGQHLHQLQGDLPGTLRRLQGVCSVCGKQLVAQVRFPFSMPGLSLCHVYGAGLTVYQLIVLAMLWHHNFVD